MRSARGFEEIPHTADWAMKVWAEDPASLFAEAARGMNALSGLRLMPGPRVRRSLEQEAPDNESLLVAFLSELIYLQEQENLGFDDFQVLLRPKLLQASFEGAMVGSIQKPIKAVTFHNLHIIQSDDGCEAEIVFDV